MDKQNSQVENQNDSAERMGKLVESQGTIIKCLFLVIFFLIAIAMVAAFWPRAKTLPELLAAAECLDPAQIAEITYSPEHENMVQLIWPDGSSGMLPWGSVLEADFDDGDGHYFTNVCNVQPIFDRLMCRLYGIGGIGGFDLQNREFWTIRVVDQRPFPHLGE
ncbi:MAG: hypothetical protein WCT37_01640 [Patescibacteria group bacterium]|jgi:hypothetical protein